MGGIAALSRRLDHRGCAIRKARICRRAALVAEECPAAADPLCAESATSMTSCAIAYLSTDFAPLRLPS